MTRYDRRSKTNATDQRTPPERDRDRVLYSEYFRRLSGVTQVASAADGGVFHNRMTHSLKVAQVGRRLAEKLLRNNPGLEPLLDASVVEAACLAHDLGHPPFGHAAEKKLCHLAEKMGLDDGFEGNAQTFRIISRLSLHSGRAFGLDLTRATLNATLKYPWKRSSGSGDAKRRKKFSAYDDDLEAFQFAREGSVGDTPCLEAGVMDLADSITYSVHDLEDFTRAGLIPLEKITKNDIYRQSFLDAWARESPNDPAQKHFQLSKSYNSIRGILEFSLSDTANPGSQEELELLEKFRSSAITHFLAGIELVSDAGGVRLKLKDELDYQCRFLHRLVKHYVISSPRLATQQRGQVRIIENLTDFFHESIKTSVFELLPVRFRQRADALSSEARDGLPGARLAIDIVASLSEAEAVLLHKRMMGQHAGSLMDPLH